VARSMCSIASSLVLVAVIQAVRRPGCRYRCGEASSLSMPMMRAT
jgi:hypothetical protein